MTDFFEQGDFVSPNPASSFWTGSHLVSQQKNAIFNKYRWLVVLVDLTLSIPVMELVLCDKNYNPIPDPEALHFFESLRWGARPIETPHLGTVCAVRSGFDIWVRDEVKEIPLQVLM